MTHPQPFPYPVNLTVTHCAVGTGGLESAVPRGREVTVTFAEERVVLIVLSAVQAQQLEETVQYFGWPAWPAPAVPPRNFEWKAIFDSKRRTFRGLFRMPPGDGESVALHVPSTPMTPAMWDMAEKLQSVVLCCGLSGDPEPADIGSAAQRDALNAVLVEAMIN
ncbi:hypothetical protein [Streptomyces sp. SID14515]|uniref:hypothetical protein n=1 Tax=Streptomyces sp. SID14515 TaxID=2706074 RepID=UPI0013C71DF8|nr:hypothetical protein [Streptomyces sp. SID14515]NEB39521.1 hypothetical protein [Streptomyces sp. SID14515]